jgi:hypothetical protein
MSVLVQLILLLLIIAFFEGSLLVCKFELILLFAFKSRFLRLLSILLDVLDRVASVYNIVDSNF